MFQYIQKLFRYFIYLLLVLVAVFANWQWPLYLWFGDTSIFRFIWLGIFFVLTDVLIELISLSFRQVRLMGEAMGFARDIRKISNSFHIVSNVVLPNNLKADYAVVGSSGVWLVTVKDDKGKVEFNGEYLVQDGVVLKGLMTKALERSYSLAGVLKEKLSHDITVTSVIAFSSPYANLDGESKNFRGIYVVGRKSVVPLIENTDIQLIDKNTIEEIYKILKK
ncbi:MAG: hypothetical protein Q8R55_01175 [Candidatus Taylorbacteria bacterium]|nr:hypothetical protein [Candidatus Taylorbacteria bacterium]